MILIQFFRFLVILFVSTALLTLSSCSSENSTEPEKHFWTVYNLSNSGLPHNLVLALAIDGSDNIWIGTWGGLTKFDGSNWTVYNTSNSGLPDNWVYALAIDGSDNIWIGTWRGGLAVYR
jgi:ligand-binding sensor domain-containing protein